MAGTRRYSAALRMAKSTPLSYAKIIGKGRKHKRSSVSLRENAASISISVDADDMAALRASLNNIMRELAVVDGIAKSDFRKSSSRRKSKNI